MVEPPAKGHNGERDFHGAKCSNETHAATTDADVRLYKKAAGQGARLCHMGRVLMESCNGLVAMAGLIHAAGTAECEAAADMLKQHSGGQRTTVGADEAAC